MVATSSSTLLPRFLSRRIEAALQDTPVVLINGPRQCGKTTLVRELLGGEREYLTLDDGTLLAAARSDPVGLVRRLDRVVIDEVQHAPELLRAIKKSVDEDRRPGRFLLTGSADLLTLPRVAESLAGRMEILTLLPLSSAEVAGRMPEFLERVFQGETFQPEQGLIGDELVEVALTGGYPEMRARADPQRRQAWARNYLSAIIERDVRDVAELDKLDRLPRLLRVLAQHVGQLVNFTQMAGQIGLDDKTARKYLEVLEQLFLVRRLEPWAHNRLNRLVKTPKLHFLDSGLLAALSGLNAARLARDRTRLGPLLETFVVAEMTRQLTWQEEAFSLHHYRDKDKNEVDLVIENELGELIGLEVKAAATVTGKDFKGLRKLAEVAGEAFRLGAVVYDGAAVVPFGDRLVALPIACLRS